MNRIVKPAIKTSDGKIHSVRGPANHIHILKKMEEKGIKEKGTRGFIDSKGKFLNRKEAMDVAVESGQLPKSYSGKGLGLHSEDLYGKVKR